MKIKIPTNYKIEYPNENKKYYLDNKASRLFKNELLNKSEEYCMYCGKSLVNHGEKDFNMEHTVEKSNGGEKTFLLHCKYNFSITCAKCNQKFKTKMIEEIKIHDFSYEFCIGKNCERICDEFFEVLNQYITKNHIIIQPNGVKSGKTNKKFEIEYNIIKEIFLPTEGEKIKYSRGEEGFILEHISRFGFNKNRYNELFVNICVIILGEIDDGVCIERIFEKLKSNNCKENRIQKLFLEFLEKNYQDISSIKLVCEFIILLNYI